MLFLFFELYIKFSENFSLKEQVEKQKRHIRKLEEKTVPRRFAPEKAFQHGKENITGPAPTGKSPLREENEATDFREITADMKAVDDVNICIIVWSYLVIREMFKNYLKTCRYDTKCMEKDLKLLTHDDNYAISYQIDNSYMSMYVKLTSYCFVFMQLFYLFCNAKSDLAVFMYQGLVIYL
ncbi:hypothetical protein MAR_023940 [Mya arenaria]|uniref:Uncharacterized protein n=1 Tax=Mya arenaria TaxID=6604 RepID=A0ABY7DPF2_MYAAR|nr:hypothetical protein MAR_023940 [Mya arenaria]